MIHENKKMASQTQTLPVEKGFRLCCVVMIVVMKMMMYIQYDGTQQLGNDKGQNLLVPSRAAKALMAALEKKQRE